MWWLRHSRRLYYLISLFIIQNLFLLTHLDILTKRYLTIVNYLFGMAIHSNLILQFWLNQSFMLYTNKIIWNLDIYMAILVWRPKSRMVLLSINYIIFTTEVDFTDNQVGLLSPDFSQIIWVNQWLFWLIVLILAFLNVLIVLSFIFNILLIFIWVFVWLPALLILHCMIILLVSIMIGRFQRQRSLKSVILVWDSLMIHGGICN